MIPTTLQHIDIEICPICGCKEIEDIRIYQKHTNGNYNEKIKFRCGYEAHYSPNFNRVEEIIKCKKDPEYLSFMFKRFTASQKLESYIKRMKTDNDFKNKILMHISHLLCRSF